MRGRRLGRLRYDTANEDLPFAMSHVDSAGRLSYRATASLASGAREQLGERPSDRVNRLERAPSQHVLGELHTEGIFDGEHHGHAGVRRHTRPEEVVCIAQFGHVDNQPCVLAEQDSYLVGDQGTLLVRSHPPSPSAGTREGQLRQLAARSGSHHLKPRFARRAFANDIYVVTDAKCFLRSPASASPPAQDDS